MSLWLFISAALASPSAWQQVLAQTGPAPVPLLRSDHPAIVDIDLIDVANSHSVRVECGLVAHDGLYLAGTRYDSEAGEGLWDDGKLVWLWRIDREGRLLWETTIGRSYAPSGDYHAIGLQRREYGQSERVRVVTCRDRNVYGEARKKHKDKDFDRGPRQVEMATVSPSGKILRSDVLGNLQHAQGAIDMGTDDSNDDHLLIYGHSGFTESPNAWVARIDRGGSIIWKHGLHIPDDLKRIPVGASRAEVKAASAVSVAHVVRLADGTFVLAIQLGIAKPRGIMLQRMDRNGNWLDSHFVEDARAAYLAPVDDGFVLTHTMQGRAALVNRQAAGYHLHLEQYRSSLRHWWTRDLGIAPLLGSGFSSIVAPGEAESAGQFVFSSSGKSPNGEYAAVLQWLTIDGHQVATAVAEAPNAYCTPIVSLRDGDEIVHVYRHRIWRSREADTDRVAIIRSRATVSPTDSPQP